MSAKSNVYRLGYLYLILNNTDLTLIGDSGGIRGSVAAGNLYLSFHTADPSGGNQSTSETTYAGYARVATPRSVSGWTIDEVNYLAKLTTGKNTGICTSTPSPGQTLTYWGVGTSSSGAGKLLYSGALVTPIPVTVGVCPALYGLDASPPTLACSVGET